MLLLLISTLIIFIFLITTRSTNGYDMTEILVLTVTVFLIVSSIQLFLSLILPIFVPSMLVTDTETIPIYSLGETNGNQLFIKIDEKPVIDRDGFVYYSVKTADGYKIKTMRLDRNVFIETSNTTQPRLVIKKEQLAPKYRWVFINNATKKYVFVVPENGIKR